MLFWEELAFKFIIEPFGSFLLHILGTQIYIIFGCLNDAFKIKSIINEAIVWIFII